MTSAEPTPLVGRDAELAMLRGLLEPGGPGAAVVSGEAGIGKTRLLREFVRAAEAEGALVLVGHCVSFGGDAVPFLPISEAFGRLARDEPDTVERLRVHYPPLARLLPQRRMVGSAGDDGGHLEPAVLYEAVLGALYDLAAARRVLLVVEDLHWADGATRDLFGFLLTRLAGEPGGAVVPVGSYRSDDLHRRHPLRTVALEWGRVPGALRVALRPLERDDVATLVRGLSGGSAADLDDAALDDVLDRVQGNAFFAEQLVAELVARPSSSVGVPRDLADLLLLRLERLSADTRHVLQLVAVAGLKIHHDRLVRVAGLDATALDAALREAAEAHVLDRRPGDKYAFRHALLAEAVYDDLLPGERRRHHAQFAEVIASQELPGTDADLARHAREAGDLTTAFDAGIRAGDEAMRVAAPGEAMRLYEAAQEIAPSVSDARAIAELPRKAAAAASHAGNPFRAAHLIEEALRRLPADVAPDVRATLLIEFVEHALALDDIGYDLIAQARQALDAVPEHPPSALRARALAALARTLSGDGAHADEAIAYSEQARAVAVQLGIPTVEADAATTRGRIERWRADPGNAEGLLRDGVARARESGDPYAMLRSRYSLAMFHYEQGRLDDARRGFAETAVTAREIGRPWAPYGADALPMGIQADYAAGYWDDALRTAESHPEAPALARAGLVAASLAVHTGRGATDVLRRAEANRPWWRRDGVLCVMGGSALIDAQAHHGDAAAALATHDDVVETISALWGSDWFDARYRLHALALGALASAAGEASAADRAAAVARGRELVGVVREVAESTRARRGGLGPESAAWVARADAEWGRLRWAAGTEAPSADELLTAWHAAVEAFGYGHRYEIARSTARLAAALQATGDTTGAQREADAARAIARDLGAQPLLTELSTLTGASRAPADRRDTDLTPREQQVLELLALGRTNRQIGRSLYISDKTVSVHVSNLMAKLGAGGRTEAAALARRAGLLT